MVTVDVAAAALGGTVQLSLPAGDDPAIGVASGNDGPVDVPLANPFTQTVSATDKVVVTTGSILARTVAPGERHVPLLHLVARNLYGDFRSLRRLRLRNATAGPGDADRAMAQLVLRRDGNANGQLDDPATDPVMQTTTWEDGIATFSGVRWQLPPGGVRHVFVTTHVDTFGAADGDSLGAVLGTAADLEFAAPSAIVGAWPLDSGARHPVDGMVAAQVRCPAVPPVSLTAGEGPVLALDVVLPSNGTCADTLQTLRLRNQGDATTTDVAALALWDDIGGDWLALDLELPVPDGGRRLFAGLTVADTPTDSATVRLAVPTDGLEMTSENDGPRDDAVVSPTSLLISTAPLLSSVAFAADRSTTEMDVAATMTVVNVGGEAVEGITPRGLTVTGDGGLTLVQDAQPASLDLPPGATGTFRWRFAGTATGPVQLTARCEGTGAVGGQPRGSLATASAVHTVLSPAVDLGLYPVANMPFSINRGQTGVVPLTLTLLNQGGPHHAELRLEQLRVTLDDGEGRPVVPADLLARVTVNEGVNIYCDRSDLETSGSVLTLDLAPAVVVTGSEPVTLGLRLDIAADTDVERFRVGLQSAGDLDARDHVSGAARTVVLAEGQFPVRSAVGSIVTQATGLEVLTDPAARRTAGDGQTAVPLLDLTLHATGTDDGSEVRVGGFAVMVTDTLGDPLPDPAARLDRLQVQGPLAIHASHPVTGPADSVVSFALAPQVIAPVGAGGVDLQILGDVRDDPVLGPLQLRLAPAADFDARDANVGAAVPVVYGRDPAAGPVVVLQQPTGALRVSGEALLPAVVAQGARAVPALRVRLAHPGPAGAAAARLDTLQVTCLGDDRQPRSPAGLLDGVRVTRDGEPSAAGGIPTATGVAIPLGAQRLGPGAVTELTVSVDLEADAPAGGLELVVAADALAARDANLQTPVPLQAAPGASLPLSSGPTTLQPAAEEIQVAWTDAMPAILPTDGGATEVLTLRLINPAEAGSAPAELTALTLRVTDRRGRPLAAGEVLTGARVRLDGAVWAEAAPAPADSALTLTGAVARSIPAAGDAAVSVQVTPRAAAAESGLRVMLRRGDVVCVQPGSATAVPVRAAPGQTFPVTTAASGLAPSDLADSYVNYPNPFAAGRASTSFAFQLAGSATVSLRIWTPRGDRVRDVLRDRPLDAGLHQAIGWDGRNGDGDVVRNGVYVAELTVRYADGEQVRLRRKVAVVR
jgi:hypothetical protein